MFPNVLPDQLKAVAVALLLGAAFASLYDALRIVRLLAGLTPAPVKRSSLLSRLPPPAGDQAAGLVADPDPFI